MYGNVWYIYLHILDFYGINVGEYTVHGCTWILWAVMLQLMQVLQLAQQPTQKLSVSNAESSVFSNTLSAKNYENHHKSMDDIYIYM